MIPIRTGGVKDMRKKIYDKILSLPIGYFSQERKGDIIARMSGDVQEVENSVTGVLDMFVKNPILIIGYFAAMVIISWQLTLFTIVFAPVMLWLMGAIGRKLKEQSLEAQALWSDTMSQVEETLGGLRVIKAFLAEKKMSARFDKTTDNIREIARPRIRRIIPKIRRDVPMLAEFSWIGFQPNQDGLFFQRRSGTSLLEKVVERND